MTARAGAALAVFLTIAFVLLAGGADQPLDSAEANKGDTGAGDAAVLGQTDAPTAEAPPVEAPPAEPAPAGVTTGLQASQKVEASSGNAEVSIPPVPEPAASEANASKPPMLGDDDEDDEGDDRGDGGEDVADGGDQRWSGLGKDRADDEGDDEGDDRDDDEGDEGWSGLGKGRADDEGEDRGKGEQGGNGLGRGRGGSWRDEIPWPSGGGKSSSAGGRGEGVNEDEGEPAPSGRPQVVLPPGQQVGGSPGEVVQPPPAAAEPAPGSGTGTLRDEPGPGEPSGGGRDRSVSFTTAAAGLDAGDQGTAGGSGGVAAGDTGGADTPAGGAGATAPSGGAGGDEGAGGGAGGNGGRGGRSSEEDEGGTDIVTNTVRDFVEVVPDSLKAALAALAALSVLLGIGYLLAALRARRLARQRRELLQEVGLLQTALLPPVPDKVGALLTSVAYRPADGPGAGGDFYDVLPLPGGRVGFILGDVSGHGRGALARTAFMRYTLRAYLEAGLEPRVALQVAGRVIDENLGGDFATVLLAVHDPGTGSLTYATAGHPAPIVVGPQPHEPVTAGSSPPIGVGVRTGLRQTTVPLVPGSVAALFTDGLMEARTAGGILGRERLAQLLDEISDDPSARRLIERVAAEATLLSDDMAAVVVTPTAGVTAGLFRTEQLELSARELDGPIARRFLEATGLPEKDVDQAEREARELAGRFGGVILHVVFGNRLSVEVLPRNVESIESASRRVSAGTAQ